MENLDKIIAKIQGLLKLAQDNPDDEEGQTALLMAQRLLLKYNLSMENVQDQSNKDKDVIKESMTEKVSRMLWWKMQLHAILANNFRCKSIRTRNFVSRKTYLRFVGYEADVKFAAKIYEATLMYLDYRLKRIREQRLGVEYKNSYLLGFLSGIKGRFEEQVESLDEFSLVLQVPVEVEKKYEKLKNFEQSKPDFEINHDAYRIGYDHATNSKIMPDELLQTKGDNNMKNSGKKAKILGVITDLSLEISSKYENIHVYTGEQVRDTLEDMVLTGLTSKEIYDLIECNQVTYEDGELIVAVGDTEVFLELQGEKYINIVTEIADPVEIMNAMKIHSITTRHPAYQELAAKLEKIKKLAIMLADLEEDGEIM